MLRTLSIAAAVMVFMWAGWSKVVTPEQPENGFLSPMALQLLGVAEIAIAALLCVKRTRVIAARYAAALASLFLLAALGDLWLPSSTACGCFGSVELPIWGRIMLLVGVLLVTAPLTGFGQENRAGGDGGIPRIRTD